MNMFPHLLVLVCLASFALEFPALGQIGRLPGSTSPSGRRGVDLPPVVPGGGRQQDKKKNPEDSPLATFTGSVRAVSAKALRIEDADSNTIDFGCSKKTRYYQNDKKIKASAIKPGDRVSVEATRAPDGKLDAVNVRVEDKKASPATSD